jgi:hypothetical protein
MAIWCRYHQIIVHTLINTALCIKQIVGTEPTSGNETEHHLLECIHVTALQQLVHTSGIQTPFRRTMGFRVALSGVSRAQNLYSAVCTHNWNNLKLVSLLASSTVCINGTRFIVSVKHNTKILSPKFV